MRKKRSKQGKMEDFLIAALSYCLFPIKIPGFSISVFQQWCNLFLNGRRKSVQVLTRCQQNSVRQPIITHDNEWHVHDAISYAKKQCFRPLQQQVMHTVVKDIPLSRNRKAILQNRDLSCRSMERIFGEISEVKRVNQRSVLPFFALGQLMVDDRRWKRLGQATTLAHSCGGQLARGQQCAKVLRSAWIHTVTAKLKNWKNDGSILCFCSQDPETENDQWLQLQSELRLCCFQWSLRPCMLRHVKPDLVSVISNWAKLSV